ncbi:MAG TPA: hypothetical protein VND19_19460 [Acetobacteraceae bacterium]|nr:hypothetical protein [Acetobacteraceae bacterium]
MSETELIVSAGAVVALRLFDVAYAIDLARAEALWAAQARASSRLRLTATPPKAMAFGVPPLALTLDPVTLEFDGAPVQAGVTARLYDFGAISIALRVPLAGMAWSGFVTRMNEVDRTLGGSTQTTPWATLLDQVRAPLASALVRPESSAIEEDYLVGLVQAFDQALSAAALQDRVDLVPLLSGEQRALSDGARQDLLRQRFSYYTDDLVVLTWDRAFIYEPRGDSDVMDVLEVANAQLLEMRYYDELLDDELPRMYDLVASARRTASLLASRRFAGLARRLYTLVAEVTELTERVDNALQVTEDVYLARIYSAALELFRVRSVSAAVDRKLAIIRDTYTALHDEGSARRAELLELLIVVLIVIEVVLALIPLVRR